MTITTPTATHLLTIVGSNGKPCGICSCGEFTKRADTTDAIHTAWVEHRPEPQPTLFEVAR